MLCLTLHSVANIRFGVILPFATSRFFLQDCMRQKDWQKFTNIHNSQEMTQCIDNFRMLTLHLSAMKTLGQCATSAQS